MKTRASLFESSSSKPINYTNPIAAKIQQRRYQLLVHAYRYYELDSPVVSDFKWDEWAKELYQLQIDNPSVAKRVKFAKEFQDFDPSTGFDLEYNRAEIIQIVERFTVDV